MVAGWYPGINAHVDRFKVTHLMNQGEGLYQLGLHDRALEKFNNALKMDSGLTFEVATFKHRIAADLLSTADSLKDLNSLKFVVYALERTIELTGGLSNTNARILDELKRKLAAKEAYDIREKIDEILTEEQKEKEEIKSIKVGMTISEVEDIMGRPSEIVANGKDDKNQLWIYRYSPRDEVYLTFTNYRLFRIEQK